MIVHICWNLGKAHDLLYLHWLYGPTNFIKAVEELNYSFNLALDWGEWSASPAGRLLPVNYFKFPLKVEPTEEKEKI